MKPNGNQDSEWLFQMFVRKIFRFIHIILICNLSFSYQFYFQMHDDSKNLFHNLVIWILILVC